MLPAGMRHLARNKETRQEEPAWHWARSQDHQGHLHLSALVAALQNRVPPPPVHCPCSGKQPHLFPGRGHVTPLGSQPASRNQARGSVHPCREMARRGLGVVQQGNPPREQTEDQVGHHTAPSPPPQPRSSGPSPGGAVALSAPGQLPQASGTETGALAPQGHSGPGPRPHRRYPKSQ